MAVNPGEIIQSSESSSTSVGDLQITNEVRVVNDPTKGLTTVKAESVAPALDIDDYRAARTRGETVAPSDQCLYNSPARPNMTPEASRIFQERTGNVIETQSNIRRLPIGTQLRQVISQGLTDTGIDGLKFKVTSGGQINKGEKGTRTGSTRHDLNSGTAADGDFVLNGRTLDGNNSNDRVVLAKAINSLAKRGIRGFGWDSSGYMGSSRFHLDLQGDSRGTPGGGFAFWGRGGSGLEKNNPGFARRSAWLQTAAKSNDINDLDQSTLDQLANGNMSPETRRAIANCANRSPSGAGSSGSGGCGGIGGGILGAAASIAAGGGLGLPSGLTGALNSVSGGAVGSLASTLQSTVGQVTNSINTLTSGALGSSVTELTSGVAGALNSIGSDILPGLTNVIPSEFQSVLNTIDSAGPLINNVIEGDVLGIIQEGVPGLGDFGQIISSVDGALGGFGDFVTSVGDIPNEIFGGVDDVLSSIDQIADFEFDNLYDFVGTEFEGVFNSIDDVLNSDLADVVDGFSEGLEGIDSAVSILQGNLDNRVDLIGNGLENTLSELINRDTVNGFTSTFNNFNSFVTQGLGQIVDSSGTLGTLAQDLKKLGDLGDLDDLYNLGAVGQVTRQIFEKGAAGVYNDLPEFVADNNINLADLSNEDQVRKLTTKLESITDIRSIDTVKNAFGMDPDLKFESLGDLLKPEKLLLNSRDSIKFKQFNELAPLMTVCSNGTGQVRTLGELGVVLDRLETVDDFDELLNEPTLVRAEDLRVLNEVLPVKPDVNTTALSMADFIGSSAGYVHENTLPKLRETQDFLAEGTMLQSFIQLNQLLIDVLNGEYIDSSTEPGEDPVFFHNLKGFSGQPAVDIACYDSSYWQEDEYYSLDTVATEIKDTIEIELSNIIDSYYLNQITSKIDDFSTLSLGDAVNSDTRIVAKELYQETYTVSDAGNFLSNFNSVKESVKEFYNRSLDTNQVTTEMLSAISSADSNLNRTEINNCFPEYVEEEYQAVLEANSLGFESARQLHKEHSLRRLAGIDFGEPEKRESFYGGVTEFPLKDNRASVVSVYVDGAFRVPGRDFEYNPDTATVVFSSAPAVDEIVDINYTVPKIKLQSSPRDSWEFAKKLEEYGKQTGYGQAAEFISKIAKDDYEGQRIQAVMVQTRNNQRLADVGIECNGFNRVNGESTDFNWVEETGIWSDDVGRASEIWLEQTQSTENYQQYIHKKIAENPLPAGNMIENALVAVLPSLLYINGNSITVSPAMVSLYFNNQSSYNDVDYNIENYRISFGSSSVSTNQYELGNYQEIVSEFARIENVQTEQFDTPLSTNTKEYLDSIGIDLDSLIGVLQKTLIVNAGRMLSLQDADIQALFGSISVTKLLTRAVAGSNS